MANEAARYRLPDLGVAEIPPPPASPWRIVGPGIVAAGVGLASGEFVLFPYIASQVGLVFVWAAALGLATQYFINMEIERYTLATGEITSKPRSVAWARQELAEPWRSLVERSLGWQLDDTVDESLVIPVRAFVLWSAQQAASYPS